MERLAFKWLMNESELFKNQTGIMFQRLFITTSALHVLRKDPEILEFARLSWMVSPNEEYPLITREMVLEVLRRVGYEVTEVQGQLPAGYTFGVSREEHLGPEYFQASTVHLVKMLERYEARWITIRLLVTRNGISDIPLCLEMGFNQPMMWVEAGNEE